MERVIYPNVWKSQGSKARALALCSWGLAVQCDPPAFAKLPTPGETVVLTKKCLQITTTDKDAISWQAFCN